VTPERGQTYRARVRMRRDADWTIKPGVELLDGLELIVQTGWLIDDIDQYLGEYAMRSPTLGMFGLTWIASGDLDLLDDAEEGCTT
jgi:hypothetical protein